MGYQDGRYSGYDRDRNLAQARGRDRWEPERGERYRGYSYAPRGEYDGRDGPAPRGRPSGYDPDDRGFFDRAGDEVRSWFGDEEAERRREYDEYYNRPYGDPRDQSSRMGYSSAGYSGQYLPGRGFAPFTGERSGYGSEDHGNRVRGYGPQRDFGSHHDSNYHAWRQDRINELDRDYAEYQRENRDRFHQEFTGWRARRGEQRQALQQVREHMEVVGSDGEHVGTVDKLRGDRIVLTRNDSDAGGVHHSVPCGWIQSVDAQRVTLEKTADQAQQAWRAEREQQAMFGNRDDDRSGNASASLGVEGGTNYR